MSSCADACLVARNWIATDILRIENGALAEYWDAIEEESPKAGSKSGLPFRGRFPD